MTEEQKAAYIFAESVAALAQIEGMKAANAERERRGEAQAYPDEAFFAIERDYIISHNNVIALFHGS